MELFDENGDLVEGALAPEDVQKLNETLKATEAEQAQLKEQLSKMENKDYNFKRLREMNEEEKKALTAKEMELLQRQEKLEEEQNQFRTGLESTWKENALKGFAGDDEELRKKIMLNFDRIKDVATTEVQIQQKMKEAYNMLGLGTSKVNPIFQANNFNSNEPINQPKVGKIDGELKGLASNLGITDEDLKQYS